MQVKELGHIVLFVRSLERSGHFYRDILGFKPIEGQMQGARAMMFSSGRTHHELLLIEVGENAPLPPRGRRAGLYHIGLKIGDTLEELKQAKKELEEAGVPILGLSDHTVSKSIYLSDPDGNEVEVFIDVNPSVWLNNPSAIMTPTKPLYI